MSHRATDWAIKQRGLKPATKMILWHLAHCHNPEHGCFPSHEYLAENAEMSVSTVQRHIKELEALGLISRSKVKRKGRFDRTEYVLHLDRVNSPPVKSTTGQNEQSPPVNSDAHHRSKCTTNIVSEQGKGTGKKDFEFFEPFSVVWDNPHPSKQTRGQRDYDEARERALRAAARGPATTDDLLF